MGGVVYCLHFVISSLLLQLLVGIVVGIVVYYLLAKLFRLEALNETINIIQSKLCKQSKA